MTEKLPSLPPSEPRRKAIMGQSISTLRGMTLEISTLAGTDRKTLEPILDRAESELAVRASRAVVHDCVHAILLGYRTLDFPDAQAWVAQAVSALEDFPAVVLARLSNPKVGIVRVAKFAPAIADLVSWCEEDLADTHNTLGLVAMQIERQRRAEARVRLAIDLATQRAAETKKAAQGASEAQQMAIHAGRASTMHDTAETVRARARQAWMGEMFRKLVETGQEDRGFSLSEADQNEATAREMAKAGAGFWFAMQKLGVEVK